MEEPERYRYLSAEEVYTLLSPAPSWTVVDLGCGTGFYTDDVVTMVDRVYALDRNRAMLDAYREKGVPENAELLTGDVTELPIAADAVDAALSLWTFHHGVAEAVSNVARVLRSGGRFVVVDWSATGAGLRDRGPDRTECWDIAAVQERLLDAGFRIVTARERFESFAVVATVR